VKKVYQNILFKEKDLSKGTITVQNLFDFTNLDQYDFKWELFENGKKIKEGSFAVNLAPHQQKEVTLPLPMIKSPAGTEYYVNVFAYTKQSTPLVAAGHEIAREQFKKGGDYFAKSAGVDGKLEVTKTGNTVRFTSGVIKGEFDLRQGRLTQYSMGNDWVLGQYPEPYFWRAPTDNDFGNNMQVDLGIWRTAHINRSVKSAVAGEQNDKGLPITIVYDLAGINVPYTVNYLIQNDGSIVVSAAIDMTGRNLPELPRFGMRMQLPSRFDQLSYYGRGPWENYSDRNTSSFVGLYNDDVKNQFTWNYIRPQEGGYKTDVRWLTLTDNNGYGLMIEGIQPICFSATNNRAEDLDPGLTKKQQHPTDIKPRNEVYLNVDLKQRGVGGDNSWGALPHQPYRLLDKQYSYSYIMRLVKK
jgi:beta-galactosidase